MKDNKKFSLKAYIEKVYGLESTAEYFEEGIKQHASFCPFCGGNDFVVYHSGAFGSDNEVWSSDCMMKYIEDNVDALNDKLLSTPYQFNFDSEIHSPVEFFILKDKVMYRTAINKVRKFASEQNATPEQEQPQEQSNALNYICNSKGIPFKIWENLEVLTKANNIHMKLDLLKKCVVVDGMGDRNVEGYDYDTVITKIRSLCAINDFQLSKDNVYDFAYCIANNNKYNSIIVFLEECKKKYKEVHGSIDVNNLIYFNQLMETLTFADDEDITFNKTILLKWLLSAVHMAYNKFGENTAHFVPVFKGKQGIGKTAWVSRLIPQNYRFDFFKEGVKLKFNEKDSIMQATKYWICEIGEIGKTLKENSRDDLKNFITAGTDEYRVPYARTSKNNTRHTVFFGTVNDDKFLRDETGNRRFVAMELKEIDYMHNVDMSLLWGEIALLYDTNTVTTYLSIEEQAINEERNRHNLVESHEQLILQEYIPFNQPQEEWAYITSTSIGEWLRLEHGQTIKDYRRIGKALKNMGYDAERVRIEGKQGRYYKLPFINGYSIPL